MSSTSIVQAGVGNSSMQVTGLASGMDWSTVIQQLANAERAPETQWQQTQSKLAQQGNAFGTISSYLNNLQADVKALQDPTLYGATTVSSSDSSTATATTSTGAIPGTYTFNISQLATASKVAGTAKISQVLVPDGNPADVTVGTAGFSTAVTAGTFTINGAQVTVSTSDSLQQVFDNIASATNNTVTASYNSTTDEIQLNSSSAITLGSASDTSNFLQVAGLYSNGSGSVSSVAALGRAKLTSALDSAGLNTTITDGGSGEGALTINGVTINYNASSDSLTDVMNRINSSGAGVTMSYDTLNNRFNLANDVTGNLSITMQDTTGNFLGATGLLSGTTTTGQNLMYTLNGGSQQLQSQSNTITTASSTIPGLSVTALKAGTVTTTVSSDTSGVTSALQKFVSDYNNVQSYITTQSAASADASGNVTSSLLTGDLTANNIATSLRSSVLNSVSVSGLTGSFAQLAQMGVTSNGHDNTLSLNTTTLNTALANGLSQVQKFFTDTTNGWATGVAKYLTATNDPTNGSIQAHETALKAQSQAITTQIQNLETKITSDTQMWQTEFNNMETAQSKTNQELSYLTQSVSSGSL